MNKKKTENHLIWLNFRELLFSLTYYTSSNELRKGNKNKEQVSAKGQ